MILDLSSSETNDMWFKEIWLRHCLFQVWRDRWVRQLSWVRKLLLLQAPLLVGLSISLHQMFWPQQAQSPRLTVSPSCSPRPFFLALRSHLYLLTNLRAELDTSRMCDNGLSRLEEFHLLNFRQKSLIFCEPQTFDLSVFSQWGEPVSESTILFFDKI